MPVITGFRRFFATSAGLRVSLLANYLGQGWTAVANIAFIPVYIHYLGVEAYGLVGVFAVILSAVTLLDSGLTPTLNRELATFTAGGHSVQYACDLLRTANMVCACGFALIAITGLFAAPFLAAYWIGDQSLPSATVVQSLYLMIVVAGLRIVEGVQRGALLGLHRHVLLNLLSIFTVTVRSGGVLLPLIFLSPTPQLFFIWQAGVSVFSVVAFAIAVKASIPRPERAARFDKAIVRGLRHFAAGVFGTSILATILTQADKMLLVKHIPLGQFSSYALASAVASGLYQLVAPVSQSFYPLLTKQMATDDGGLALSYHQGSQIVAATVGPPAAILALFAGPVLTLWTGDAKLAASAAPVLTLLALGTACHCALYMPYMLQLAAGWSTLAMRMNILAVLLVVPSLLIVVPRFGMIGAATIWLSLNGASLAITIQIMHSKVLPKEMIRWYSHDLLIPFGVAFSVSGFLRFFYPEGAGTLTRISALAAASAFTLVASAISAPLLRERIKEIGRTRQTGTELRRPQP